MSSLDTNLKSDARERIADLRMSGDVKTLFKALATQKEYLEGRLLKEAGRDIPDPQKTTNLAIRIELLESILEFPGRMHDKLHQTGS